MNPILITSEAEIVQIAKDHNPPVVFYKLRSEFIDICRTFGVAHVIDIRVGGNVLNRKTDFAPLTVFTAPAPAMLAGWRSSVPHCGIVWDYRHSEYWQAAELEQAAARINRPDWEPRPLYLYRPENHV